jgi:hypothetical protein
LAFPESALRFENLKTAAASIHSSPTMEDQ